MKLLILFTGLAFTLTGCGDDSTSYGNLSALGSQAPASCQAVATSCSSAGFAQGEWASGTGLWRNCVNPIMQGQTGTVAGNSQPLPTVDASVITACRNDAGGRYGSGQVGSGSSSTLVTATSTSTSPSVTATATDTGIAVSTLTATSTTSTATVTSSPSPVTGARE